MINVSHNVLIERVTIETIGEIDTSYSIIFGPDGRVMGGMHRIAQALLDGSSGTDAVSFTVLPEPDHRHFRPHDLPY